MVSYAEVVPVGVFKALADASRRRLLDALRERGGQDVTELAATLPHLSRFTVAKHLGVLVEADLVTVTVDGRHRRHQLNPVPLQEMHARWLGRFTAGGAQALLDLRTHLEQEATMPNTIDTTNTTTKISADTYVFTIVIRCSAQQLWEALTETDVARPWLYGTITTLSTPAWEIGTHYSMGLPDQEIIVGTVVETDPPRRLVLTFDARWDEQATRDPAGRMIYELDEDRGATTLTVTMTGMGGATAASVAEDTPEIYSGLKSIIETGQPLRDQ